MLRVRVRRVSVKGTLSTLKREIGIIQCPADLIASAAQRIGKRVDFSAVKKMNRADIMELLGIILEGHPAKKIYLARARQLAIEGKL